MYYIRYGLLVGLLKDGRLGLIVCQSLRLKGKAFYCAYGLTCLFLLDNYKGLNITYSCVMIIFRFNKNVKLISFEFIILSKLLNYIIKISENTSINLLFRNYLHNQRPIFY